MQIKGNKMILQFKKETISYCRKDIDCIVLKTYRTGFEKSKHYLIAEITERSDKGNIRYNISEVTKKTDGVVFIRWDKLIKAVQGKNFLRMKLYTGKGSTYRYWIYRNITVSDFTITADVTEYKPEPRFQENREQALQLADIPF
jgi:hypothetical protein